MKKLMFVLFLAVLIGCSKEPTPEPVLTEYCLECLDSLTMEQAAICDDTMTIRVWMEVFQNQNDVYGHKWNCKRVPAKL